MDMGSAMIVVMAVMMLAMLGGGLWGAVTALRSRARRLRHPERPSEQDVDKPTSTEND
jgi:uncharacterized membrane protein